MNARSRLQRAARNEPVRPHYGPRRERARPHPEKLGVLCGTFENYTVAELVTRLEGEKGGLRELMAMYDVRRAFPDMSNFRLGPNMFAETALDWIAFHTDPSSPSPGRLVAHGIATRIRWDADPEHLPRGWTGAVRQSYEEGVLRSDVPTTLVGLFIFVGEAFREFGWAADVVEAMKRVAAESGLRELVIPLRLPTRYEHRNVEAPYEEFALRKRDDGAYCDHWLRLHVRLGAEVIGVCASSHQHAMHPDDLRRQIECGPIERTGEYTVTWNGESYRAFVDLEREFALINQGCVWVRHRLDAASGP